MTVIIVVGAFVAVLILVALVGIVLALALAGARVAEDVERTCQ